MPLAGGAEWDPGGFGRGGPACPPRRGQPRRVAPTKKQNGLPRSPQAQDNAASPYLDTPSEAYAIVREFLGNTWSLGNESASRYDNGGSSRNGSRRGLRMGRRVGGARNQPGFRPDRHHRHDYW